MSTGDAQRGNAAVRNATDLAGTRLVQHDGTSATQRAPTRTERPQRSGRQRGRNVRNAAGANATELARAQRDGARTVATRRSSHGRNVRNVRFAVEPLMT